MKEFQFDLENRPGALAEVAEAFGEERVNIEGIAGVAGDDKGLIRLVVDDAGKARRALGNLGIAFEEKEVLVIDVPNHPGELATVLRRLAEEGLNVESCYAGVERNKLVLAVDQVNQAKRILRIS